ncbi:hypothetical protein MMC10_005861 [Thelotrema lepadinum]|nr:hypothetical protein [Thelotrema lepadinum]
MAVPGWPPVALPVNGLFFHDFWGNTKKSYLLDLPSEMFQEVLVHLPPVARLALSSTCRALANLLPRSTLLPVVLDDPKLQYDLRCLGERDGHSGSYYACDHCTIVHKKARFPQETARVRHNWEQGDRTCIAGRNSVELFPRFWFSHQDLRLLVKWWQTEQASSTTRNLRVHIEDIRAWDFALKPGHPVAFDLIKKAWSREQIPVDATRMDPYTPAASSQGFTIHNGNVVVSHTVYHISFHAHLRRRFRPPPPSIDPIAEELTKPENAIVACPHFGPSQAMTYLNTVRQLFPNITHRETYQAMLARTTVPRPLGISVIKCQRCSSRITVHPDLRSASLPLGPDKLIITVDREIGPPDQADNILWVNQLPATLELTPD